MIIRAAMLADAHGIAQVHVDTWSTTYAGLIPAEVIASRTIEGRTDQWEATISAADPQQLVLVAVDQTKIVGFIHAGPERKGDPHYTGEVYCLYVRQEAQGQGVGTQLITRAFEFLRHQHKAALIWVLEGNIPAERFYAAMGGRSELHQNVELEGMIFHDLGYVWEFPPTEV